MLQQDLLDTLFLNRKALADAGAGDTQPGANRGIPTTTTTSNFAMKDAASTGGASADVCPVDHKSREAWLKHAQTAAAQDAQQPPQPQAPSTADACPVDHKSREAWLKHAQTAAAQEAHSAQGQAQPETKITTTQQQSAKSSSGWGWRIPFFSTSSAQPASENSSSSSQSSKTQQTTPTTNTLGQDREVSTIPRSTPPDGALHLDTARPSNHETETGADARTGNWVYPSEKMFFDAMKRKGHDTRAADMKTVVPIHNAVNERAWVEIKAWERPYLGDVCPGGPRLDSFTGLSSKMSPKARLNTLLGFTPPFDRHDWVVDRCGTKVEYVIDFYTGKTDKAGRPSFYLDVRPKLNSWEGARMRASRILGLV